MLFAVPENGITAPLQVHGPLRRAAGLAILLHPGGRLASQPWLHPDRRLAPRCSCPPSGRSSLPDKMHLGTTARPVIPSLPKDLLQSSSPVQGRWPSGRRGMKRNSPKQGSSVGRGPLNWQGTVKIGRFLTLPCHLCGPVSALRACFDATLPLVWTCICVEGRFLTLLCHLCGPVSALRAGICRYSVICVDLYRR